MAGIATCGLLLACSGAADEDGLDAPLAEAEEPLETSPANEAEPEPEATEEPVDEPADDAPAIGEDEPLYAPLPELTPDPDNDIPDELEQLILDAFAEAYEAEQEAYAAAEADEEHLRRTHFGDGLESVLSAVEYLQERGGRELTPDAEIVDVYFVDFQGGSAIIRECVLFGPRSGLYDSEELVLIEEVPSGNVARDRMVELAAFHDEDEPSLRVTQIGFASPDECGGN